MSLSLEGHTARAFDGDLSSLHIQAVAMGALVIEQVQLAVNAYSTWDRSIATLVLERERKINLYDAEIEEAALQVIARRQPVAQDLRAVFAIDKVVTELERAADEAKKLALTVLADSDASGFRPGAATAREARQLGRLASQMIRAALEAFDRLDPGGRRRRSATGPGNGFRICRGAAAHSHARHGRRAPAARGHRGRFHHAFAGAHR